MKREFEESNGDYEIRQQNRRYNFFNWTKLAAVGTALLAFGTIAVYLGSKVFASQLGDIPDTVNKHTIQISDLQIQVQALQLSDITNDIIINNNFDRQYEQIKWIEKRLNNNSTNGIP